MMWTARPEASLPAPDPAAGDITSPNGDVSTTDAGGLTIPSTANAMPYGARGAGQ